MKKAKFQYFLFRYLCFIFVIYNHLLHDLFIEIIVKEIFVCSCFMEYNIFLKDFLIYLFKLCQYIFYRTKYLFLFIISL